MDEDHMYVRKWTPVVEVQLSTTPRVLDMLHLRALDAVDRGARHIGEKVKTIIGVAIQRQGTNGISHQSIPIVGKHNYCKPKSNFLNGMLKFDDMKYYCAISPWTNWVVWRVFRTR